MQTFLRGSQKPSLQKAFAALLVIKMMLLMLIFALLLFMMMQKCGLKTSKPTNIFLVALVSFYDDEGIDNCGDDGGGGDDDLCL